MRRAAGLLLPDSSRFRVFGTVRVSLRMHDADKSSHQRTEKLVAATTFGLLLLSFAVASYGILVYGVRGLPRVLPAPTWDSLLIANAAFLVFIASTDYPS